ncbi:MAG TPA: hypothetical protein VKA53_02205, partial [Thermoanaerobaculia bacterium]|nr:hypothetical protein [Thermoanaerobaculia bacterium]
MRRALAWAAGGAVASLLAQRWLPLPTTDPLRGTLAVIPFIACGLVTAARVAGLKAPLPGPRWWSLSQAALLAFLVLATLGRAHLGLGDNASLLILCGFALLLFVAVARLLFALAPTLGDRLPHRPGLIFFLLPLLAYWAILPWSAAHHQPDGDEPYYLLITHSLAYDFDANLTNNYRDHDWRAFINRPLAPQPGDPVGPHGELYSRHNLTLPLLLAPAYRLAGRTGALVMMTLLAALLAWMTLRLAYRYYPERPVEGLIAYALVAFTPPLLLYSYQVWIEVPGALLTMLALDRILDLEPHQPWGWRRWLSIGAPIFVLPLVKIRLMLLAVALAALAWWKAGRPRKPLLLLIAALGLLGIGILAYNQALYGNPLKIHTWQEVEIENYPIINYALGFFGLFFDCAFGLFSCAPIWMLVIPAFLLLLYRRHKLVTDLVVLATPYFLIVLPRLEWYGGWCPPFRYALVFLPLFAVGLVPLLAHRDRGGARALLMALGALTVILTLLWLAVPGWTYNFADGRSYLIDLLSGRWHLDVARFFPSYVRPRSADWWWPLLSLVLLPPLWWRPRRSRGAALWGMGLLLLVAAALPIAARTVPSHRLEFEERQVTK